MVAVVKALPQEILDHIECREWSFRDREGVLRGMQLKVKSLPSITINEKMAFEAEIPPLEDLIQAIRDVRKES